MFNRLNNYLLTHYPLLWNTKAITVVSVSLLLHLLFFVFGYTGLDVTTLGRYDYSLYPAESSGMYTLSFLFSMAILIGWLVFFLRNNAFKEYYVIDKWFLAKQFILVTLIIFVSVTFFHSYRWGLESRARSFTSREELVRETDLLNLAAKFLPEDRSSYFKLNSCSLPDSMHVSYRDDYNYFDTTLTQNNQENNRRMRQVLKDADAFRYETYCKTMMNVEGMDNGWLARSNGWIRNGQKDSIRHVITGLQKVADKYRINYRLHVDSLVGFVFQDSLHTVKRTIGYSDPSGTDPSAMVYDNDGSAYVPDSSSRVRTDDYIEMREIENALNFIDRAHYRRWSEDELMFQTILLYAAICSAVVIMCYRLFTRKVFLFSVIGTIVWTILLVGLGIGSGSGNTILVFLLLLCFGSLLASRIDGFGKTTRGVLLTWHIWLLPFVTLILLALVHDVYNSYDQYIPGTVQYYSDAQMKKMYPVTYWITHHNELLARINLLLVVVYVAFVFMRLARKWHTSAEE
ncbi:MAG: hypothetical protein EOO05_04895 [Chitinophagaceae bacterium]|nr:MAG: hypothetical protein EOO05_04895 [Chitinophagaceae bacterium]